MALINKPCIEIFKRTVRMKLLFCIHQTLFLPDPMTKKEKRTGCWRLIYSQSVHVP